MEPIRKPTLPMFDTDKSPVSKTVKYVVEHVGKQGAYSDAYLEYSEGLTFQKTGNYRRAVQCHTKALELKTGDKITLIARSQCYLHLGEPDKALNDANETLSDEPNYIKGLLQKAEAYYQQAKFEYSLMFYHRGNKLRPEVQAFRLGIQKAQEAIDNSVGDVAGVRLENKGDLESFYAEQQTIKQTKRAGGYSKPTIKREVKKDKVRPAMTQDRKTVKQLLGELYRDKEYLEEILKESESVENKSETKGTIRTLAVDGLGYLHKRMEFWQQQQRSRTLGKAGQTGGQGTGKADPTQWVLKNLEEIDEAQGSGKHEKSLKLAKRTLKTVENWSDDDVANRAEVVANLHSCIGNAYLELGKNNKALEHYERDFEIAKQKNLSEAKSRALDNLGRVYARMKKFQKAIDVWEEKLPMSSTPLESTWLYHEIGRCYLEIDKFEEAKDFGERSKKSAMEAEDEVWQLNASVLIAQAHVKLGDLQAALDQFENSLDMAKVQGDKAAEFAIKKAIEDINSKIVKGDGKEEDTPEKSPEYDNYEDDFEGEGMVSYIGVLQHTMCVFFWRKLASL
ncbi:hypothetical protein NP493_60g01047 [Ridgeia piscesae]|uniref:Outer dynein arm-docking complex subunit 4 n=1 Tax=Ridgeia piscesae TaxID=27915 RepID=A0AAD9PA54_RIDPI|nr:hypothetical protein NP493_60g01047 [Ridgeia piscesae]